MSFLDFALWFIIAIILISVLYILFGKDFDNKSVFVGVLLMALLSGNLILQAYISGAKDYAKGKLRIVNETTIEKVERVDDK